MIRSDRIDSRAALKPDMHRINASSLSLLLILILGCPLWARTQDAQSRDQDEPIRLKSDLVSVTASVTDSSGRAIKSLKAEDFVIYEDGARQKIAHFTATEAPFTLLLLLDLSGSTHDDIDLMKRAAKNFLAELRFDDRVGVIAFSREVEMIAELTDPRAEVSTAIDRITTAAGEDGYRFSSNTGTSFYDALYLAVEESPLKQAEGRKAIVCMSDGVDSSSKMKFKDIVPLVEKSGASIYFLELNTEAATLEGLLKPKTDPDYINFSQSQVDRYYEEHDPHSADRFRPRSILSPATVRDINAGLYSISRREIRTVAERTGGRVFPVQTLSDLNTVYKRLADDLHSQYSIGYYPSNGVHDGRWRTIRVETRERSTTVHARSGYRAPGE
jgi:VWFA-related protein